MTILRVSVRRDEIDAFISKFTTLLLPKMTNLVEISIFEAFTDGSVRLPVRTLNMLDKYSVKNETGGIQVLVLQVDPSTPSVKLLISIVGKTVTTVALLRGCSFSCSNDLSEFLHNVLDLSSVRCMHFGDFGSDMDMDSIIPSLLHLKYLQYSYASASIESMKLAMNNIEHCEFDAISFLLR